MNGILPRISCSLLILQICEVHPMELKILSSSGTVPEFSDRQCDVWHDPDGKVCAYASKQRNVKWIHIPLLAHFSFEPEQNPNSIKANPYPDASTELIYQVFQRIILPMVLQDQGSEVLHASAVRAPGGVIAFCADSGTGKSTTAYGFTRRGFTAWADDALVLEPQESSVSTVSLPFTIRLFQHTAEFFGSSPTNSSSQYKKELLPLRAVFVLERLNENTPGASIVRLAPADALVALLKHAWCFTLDDPDRKKKMMENYLKVANGVPVFSVKYPSGLDRLSGMIDSILGALTLL